MKKLKNDILILTGGIHTGKTTLAKAVTDKCKAENVPVHGFLSIGHFKHNQRSGFSLLDIDTGQKYPLAATVNPGGWEQYRRFWFNPQTIATGNYILQNNAEVKRALIIVDEIGPLEIDEKGWNKGLAYLLQHNQNLKIFVIRQQIVHLALAKYNISNYDIINVDETDPNEFFNLIIQYISEEQKLTPNKESPIKHTKN